MTLNDTQASPRVDAWTMVGLALLLLPLLTMAHELLGHAVACVATGHQPSELGAYYVECPGTNGWSSRMVAMAGTCVDVVLAALACLAWRRVERPMPRLVLWMVFVLKGMVAGGYWMFSGVTNFGDWGPGAGGGIGPLPFPWLWRIGLFLVGLFSYRWVVRVGTHMLIQMLGGGDEAGRVKRNIAMTIYVVGGVSALLVGLFNPHGIAIILMSAVASSFGGLAGLFNVGYSKRSSLPARNFHIDSHNVLVAAGLLMALAFAAILGPTIYLH